MSGDKTCILRRYKRFSGNSETVICGWCVAENYLRQGYVFDWHATDAARQRELATSLNNPTNCEA